MPQPTIVPDVPEKGGLTWGEQLAVALVMVVVVALINMIAGGLNGTLYRSTEALRNLNPGSLPDLGWRLCAPFVGNIRPAALVTGTFAPVISIVAVCGMLWISGQPLWTSASLIYMYTLVMAVRAICQMVTYMPPVWTEHDGIMATRNLPGSGRFSITPSGHTLTTLLPLLFAVLLFTDEDSLDRSMALLATFFVVFIPIILIFATRMHHTMSVLISAFIALLAAYVATDRALSWEAPLMTVVGMLVVLCWNLLSFGLPVSPGSPGSPGSLISAISLFF
jgi:hypothetical protein